jgi:Leucine-rich repeat (LRR) protein
MCLLSGGINMIRKLEVFIVVVAFVTSLAIGCQQISHPPDESESNIPDVTHEPNIAPSPVIDAEQDDENQYDVISINGVDYCTSLTELVLGGEDLNNQDIASLQYMTNLSSLYISFTQVNDLSPLSELTNLE